MELHPIRLAPCEATPLEEKGGVCHGRDVTGGVLHSWSTWGCVHCVFSFQGF